MPPTPSSSTPRHHPPGAFPPQQSEPQQLSQPSSPSMASPSRKLTPGSHSGPAGAQFGVVGVSFAATPAPSPPPSSSSRTQSRRSSVSLSLSRRPSLSHLASFLSGIEHVTRVRPVGGRGLSRSQSRVGDGRASVVGHPITGEEPFLDTTAPNSPRRHSTSSDDGVNSPITTHDIFDEGERVGVGIYLPGRGGWIRDCFDDGQEGTPALVEVVRRLGEGTYAIVYLVREIVLSNHPRFGSTPSHDPSSHNRDDDDVFSYAVQLSEPDHEDDDRVYGRYFALKCLCKRDLSDELIQVQRGEAILHRALPDHDNIVRLHGAYETDDWLFLVLEYCPGQDLYYWLDERADDSEALYDLHSRAASPFQSPRLRPSSSTSALQLSDDEADQAGTTYTPDNLLLSDATPPSPSLLSSTENTSLLSRRRLRLISRMFAQMCDAVQACHNVGISHRDIKPENFIVSDGRLSSSLASLSTSADLTASTLSNSSSIAHYKQSSRVVVKITDWGLGTDETECEDFDCGSKPYMAYECRNNLSPSYDPRQADVWSLGLVLLNLLFHRNPWADPSLSDPDFAEYVRAPTDFLKSRFRGIGDEVATFLAERVFCDVLDKDPVSGLFKKRVSAGEFGKWATGLVSMMGEPKQAGVSNNTFALANSLSRPGPLRSSFHSHSGAPSLLSQLAPPPHLSLSLTTSNHNPFDDLPSDLRDELPSVVEERPDQLNTFVAPADFLSRTPKANVNPSAFPKSLPLSSHQADQEEDKDSEKLRISAALGDSEPGVFGLDEDDESLPSPTFPDRLELGREPEEERQPEGAEEDSVHRPLSSSSSSSSTSAPPHLPPPQVATTTTIPIPIVHGEAQQPVEPIIKQDSQHSKTILTTSDETLTLQGDSSVNEEQPRSQEAGDTTVSDHAHKDKDRSKRRKRGARKAGKFNTTNGTPSSPLSSSPTSSTTLAADLATASQHLARELSKKTTTTVATMTCPPLPASHSATSSSNRSLGTSLVTSSGGASVKKSSSPSTSLPSVSIGNLGAANGKSSRGLGTGSSRHHVGGQANSSSGSGGGMFGKMRGLVMDGNQDLNALRQRVADRNADIYSAPAKMQGRSGSSACNRQGGGAGGGSHVSSPSASFGTLSHGSRSADDGYYSYSTSRSRGRSSTNVTSGGGSNSTSVDSHWSSASSRRERQQQQRLRLGSPATSSRATLPISTSPTSPSGPSVIPPLSTTSSASTSSNWRNTSPHRSSHARGGTYTGLVTTRAPSKKDAATDTADLLPLSSPVSLITNMSAPTTTSSLSTWSTSVPSAKTMAVPSVLSSSTVSSPPPSQQPLQQRRLDHQENPVAAKPTKLAKMLNSISVFNRSQERQGQPT